MGCAMPEAEQGLNVARIASLRATPVSASAATINRFCASGLEAIATASARIAIGAADAILAGGTESMSLIRWATQGRAQPASRRRLRGCVSPTGLVAENHERRRRDPRDEQDAFAASRARDRRS
jgi:acetyl-CoA acyltransferase